MSPWLIVIAAIFANALAGVFMKLVTTRAPIEFSMNGLVTLLHNPFAYLAVACYVTALGLFTLALARLELSVAYTSIVSGAIVVVTILSVLLFQENFTALKAAAIVLILSGVFLLYKSAS